MLTFANRTDNVKTQNVIMKPGLQAHRPLLMPQSCNGLMSRRALKSYLITTVGILKTVHYNFSPVVMFLCLLYILEGLRAYCMIFNGTNITLGEL